MKSEDGEPPHPLYDCVKDHPKAEIFAGNAASILPIDLGISLIGIGYEEPDKINAALRATKQFSGAQETPLWRRFVEWRLMSAADLESNHKDVMSYVFDAEEIEPGPYLHMANDLISIAKHGDGNGTEISKKIEERIKALSEKGMIPAAKYGVEYGWSDERGFSFGGYAYDPKELEQPLIAAMKSAQMKAFTATTAKEAERILGLLAEDLDAFEQEVTGRNGHTGYRRTEILHLIDPQKFAEVVFSYIISGDFEAIGSVLKSLAERHLNLNGKKKEGCWPKEVRNKLLNIAAQSGPLEKARMHWFLGFHWKFPNEGESPGLD